MTLFFAALLYIAIAILLIPVLVLFVQAVVAFPVLRAGLPLAGQRPRIAVLVPAHNEEAGVAATIASVLPQLTGADRLLVVADNCNDATASVASTAGAEVRERSDLSQRGKGYALDFGVRCLADNPPDVLIIADADCIVTSGAIDQLARKAMLTSMPVQALYLMHAPAGSSPMKRVSEFAWTVKNLVRPLGFHRLGLPCQLMGAGMAFPWSTISSASLANGHIVEDLKLGIDLAIKGTPPVFYPHAMVYSTFPASVAGAQTQRTRWEHGHLSMMLSEAPNMLSEGIRQRKIGVIAMALDLCVPPVALLMLLVIALFSGALLFGLVTGVLWPLALSAVVLSVLGSAVLLSWWRYGKQILSAQNLGMAVIYMLAKIPLYLKFLVSRQVEWVRSKRDSE